MAELTDQQRHLQQVIEQQNQLISDINQLQAQIDSKRQMAVKLQGVMEYLTELGTTLPEPEEAPVESPVEEDTSGKGFAEEA